MQEHSPETTLSPSVPRKVIVIGGVAGGMSAATRLRRLDERASITVLERSGHVSYANCGLPYFVGSVIEEEAELLLQTPERLHDRFRLDVRVGNEVVGIDRERHQVRVRSAGGGEPEILNYDKLILSPGASPVRLNIPGSERMRVLRTVEDAQRIVGDVAKTPRTAVVVGAGFVGLETAENLSHHGIAVTVVEAAPQVLPALDPELAVMVEEELMRHQISVITGASVMEVHAWGVTLSDGREVEGELVVASVGVRPDVRLASLAGLAIGPHGGIEVNEANVTSDPDIYAVGDAVEKFDGVSEEPSLIALANVANRQGRRVADHICGLSSRHVPSIGTAVVRVFGMVAATTGWNERRLREAGRQYQVVRAHPMNHASYYPGAEPMSLKLLFDPVDGMILGAQAIGGAGVDKRIDVLATAMSAGLPVEELANLELAYAPPFSSAKDPVNMLGYIAENVRFGECDIVEPDEVQPLVDAGWTLLDVRTPAEHLSGSVPGSVSAPVDELRDKLHHLGDGPFLVYCAVGLRGHVATMLLSELGFQARNLNGGYRTYTAFNAARRVESTVV
ncbi:FAD-dependent oxidoreductase [Ferrimicrobium sp.]|uniref:FAD-dependent oxidoreductase n=1 Tax=Ferrimicrobium sp. TaxID=2926050 RepID=UPI00260B0298|nr:FAD-dependent oxidoreductase [Ferrimicrobium sp.]